MLRRYLNQLRQYNDTQFPGLNHTFYFDNSRGQFKNHNILGVIRQKSSLTTNYAGIEIAPNRIKISFNI